MTRLSVLLFSLLIVSTSYGTCNITLAKKSATTKAAFIGNQSISAKVQTALSSVCNVRYRLMTYDEQIAIEKEKYAKKILKLKSLKKMK